MSKPIAKKSDAIRIKALLAGAYRRTKRFLNPFSHECRRRFRGLKVLEIGGPSDVFRSQGEFPIYPYVSGADNINFSGMTVWEGDIAQGMTFRYRENAEPGLQYIAEASNLSMIPDGTYDAVISSHTLEHTANPLKALLEWKRVIRPGGYLLVIVPFKSLIFDHNREDTTFEHLYDDLQNNTQEDDLTHLDEILTRHDLSRDLAAGTIEQFEARSRRNVENRCLHHHVFSSQVMKTIVDFLEMKAIDVGRISEIHVLSLMQKSE